MPRALSPRHGSGKAAHAQGSHIRSSFPRAARKATWSTVERGDPYGFAKLGAEQLVMGHARSRGTYDVVAINPVVVFGPCLTKAHTARAPCRRTGRVVSMVVDSRRAAAWLQAAPPPVPRTRVRSIPLSFHCWPIARLNAVFCIRVERRRPARALFGSSCTATRFGARQPSLCPHTRRRLRTHATATPGRGRQRRPRIPGACACRMP